MFQHLQTFGEVCFCKTTETSTTMLATEHEGSPGFFSVLLLKQLLAEILSSSLENKVSVLD